MGLAGEGGSFRLSGPLEKPPFVNFPRRAFGGMRLGKGDAFQLSECLLRGEEMKSLAGVVAGDDARGSPGDLDHVSLGHDGFLGALCPASFPRRRRKFRQREKLSFLLI
jgi:hypothetical protein